MLSGLIAAVPASTAENNVNNNKDFTERANVTNLWQPEPPIVTPGLDGRAPSDAIVLFDGSKTAPGDGLLEWESVSGGPAKWQVADGAMTVVPQTGDIRTKREFSDIQLHLEWRSPRDVQGEGQSRGNSGVFLMERYEVQVLDSFDNLTYANGQAASVYKQHIPLVNASLGPGAWQTYDIFFTAPRFGDTGRVIQSASITVLHNGVLVQNHVTIQGPTTYIGAPSYVPHDAAPIRLQDHNNPVSFRNIWVRVL